MPRSFRSRLAAVVAIAFAVRLVYALVVVGDSVLIGDGLEFDMLADHLADGKGYVDPFLLEAEGVSRATAFKPPGYAFALAGASLLTGGGYEVHHVLSCLFGALTVTFVGFLGREVAGERTGLLAAGIAALYPLLVAIDGSLRSESLYVMLVSAALLLAARALRSPGAARGLGLGLGAVIGLAALTRTEALGLLVLLGAPLVWRERSRVAPVALAFLAAAVVVAPWTVRNWVTFDQPVLVATNEGGVFRGANCDKSYYGEGIGFWFFECFEPGATPGAVRIKDDNEAERAAEQRRQGLEYARGHAGRAVVVAGVRVLRTWDLYKPRDQAAMTSFLEGRPLRFQQLGTAVYFLLAVLAVAGAFVLRHRRRALALLLAPVALVTFSSAISYGFPRFRAGAEPAIVVLAAVAVSMALERRASGARGTSTS